MFVFTIACGFVGGRLAPGTHLFSAVQTKFLQFSDKNDLHFTLSLDYELSYSVFGFLQSLVPEMMRPPKTDLPEITRPCAPENDAASGNRFARDDTAFCARK